MPATALIRIAAFALSALASSATAQQPSFDCDRARLPAEIMVCKAPELAVLDVRMADLFVAVARSANPSDRLRLRDEQLLWQRWRNACIEDIACLRRRYEARIADFRIDGRLATERSTGIVPLQLLQPGTTTRRIRDGRYERVAPDGTIHWTAIDGSGQGVTYPDDRPSTVFMFQNVGGDDYPRLPPGNLGWAHALEDSLVQVIHGLLRPQDRPTYDAIHQAKALEARLFAHVDALRVYAGESD